MLFGMMEAQRWYNTGQTKDYFKYKWISPEAKGFKLVLDFGFGFLLSNERPGEPSIARFAPGGRRRSNRLPPIWKIIAFQSHGADVYEFSEDEKEDAVRGVYNYLMHGGQSGWALDRAFSMLRKVLSCQPRPEDETSEFLLKQIPLQNATGLLEAAHE